MFLYLQVPECHAQLCIMVMTLFTTYFSYLVGEKNSSEKPSVYDKKKTFLSVECYKTKTECNIYSYFFFPALFQPLIFVRCRKKWLPAVGIAHGSSERERCNALLRSFSDSHFISLPKLMGKKGAQHLFTCQYVDLKLWLFSAVEFSLLLWMQEKKYRSASMWLVFLRKKKSTVFSDLYHGP